MSDEGTVSTRTLTVLTYGVLTVWAANLLGPLFVRGFESSTGANGVMGALLGLLGAARYQTARTKARKKNKQVDDE